MSSFLTLDQAAYSSVTYTWPNGSSSPMFPTPRRALFTTAAMMDSLESRGKLGTLVVVKVMGGGD